MSPSRILRLALVPVLAGCTALPDPGSPEDAALLARPGPLGRECRVARTPEQLPPVDLVVDSASLARSVAALRAGGNPTFGYALVSLLFDQNGWNARREVIDHDLPSEVADSLQTLVFAHRREVRPGRPWGVRLRLDLGEPLRLRLDRQEVCAPRLLDARLLEGAFAPWDVRERYATMAPTSTVWLQVLVDPSGQVTEARVQSGPGGVRWQAALLDYVHSLRFAPAMIDGIPVAGWVRVPISVPH